MVTISADYFMNASKERYNNEKKAQSQLKV